jgi:hypothetical protein
MAAVEEADKAAAWYDSKQAGVGAEFLQAFAQVIGEIEADPQRFPKHELVELQEDVRRANCGKYPYLVVYELVGDVPVILAVMHKSRRPDYWLNRLQKRSSTDE